MMWLTSYMSTEVHMYVVLCLLRLSSATVLSGFHAPAGMHHRGSKLVLMQIVAVSQYSLMKQMVSSRLYASADHSGPPL